ncbi:MAG TPA: ethanolamine ammonia-lyase subunit EutC [Devosiaceae bacterium]|nr:ethanolamine ammonia-lyase subunit EutC [Devosiaceae bacterium]
MTERSLRADPFAAFRGLTPARIGLGRSGDAILTQDLLALQMAHARARDAIHAAADFAQLARQLADLKPVVVQSRAPDRAAYLLNPDLGRQLDPTAAAELPSGSADVAFVLGDGLSASALDTHGEPVLRACLARLGQFSVARPVLARQARVALGDEIGERLGAKIVVMLLGERPGLSVPDSLGAYLTYAPRKGRRDSERNCVSNIHASGLAHEQAADKICWLIREALRRGVTGIELKDEAEASAQSRLP